MWVEWFIRCSTSISRWSLRFLRDECKRHRYILSFSPLLFINNRHMNPNLLRITNEEYQWKYSNNQSTIFVSSVIGATAAAMFSWENDGISDEELYV